MDVPVASLVTQVLVSADDPAMQHPTKPIGPFYSRADAEEKKRLLGWQIVEDAARGYRRVVPSPDPVEILELDVIRSLINRGVLVVSTGGGGIPVMLVNGRLQGVEAVIDKDRASALLATQLGVDLFAITTDTEYVYLNYKKAGPGSADACDRFATGRVLPGRPFSARATWGRRWSRCCASCAAAARKPSLPRMNICSRRLRDGQVRTSSLTLNRTRQRICRKNLRRR